MEGLPIDPALSRRVLADALSLYHFWLKLELRRRESKNFHIVSPHVSMGLQHALAAASRAVARFEKGELEPSDEETVERALKSYAITVYERGPLDETVSTAFRLAYDLLGQVWEEQGYDEPLDEFVRRWRDVEEDEAA
jgi:hypothetical protein